MSRLDLFIAKFDLFSRWVGAGVGVTLVQPPKADLSQVELIDIGQHYVLTLSNISQFAGFLLLVLLIRESYLKQPEVKFIKRIKDWVSKLFWWR